MNNILELCDIQKNFNGFSLRDISFALPEGFIMGFIGPNGAGKTTTIKLILNMLRADGGKIKLFGEDYASGGRIHERIGVVMDQPFYVNEWSLMDVEKALSPFYQKWNSAKYRAMLKDFCLEPKKKVKELSRGMSVKLMIAVALSHEADLLILDEPTSGLDAVARNELVDLLSGFVSDDRKGVLFSTHITADLEKIADYITFVESGRILYSGTKDDLMDHYRLVKGGRERLSAEQRRQVLGYREHEVGFDGLVEAAKLKILPGSVIAEPVSLDDIVLRFNLEGKRDE